MMTWVAKAIGVLVVAAAIAIGSAWAVLLHYPLQTDIANGSWRTSLAVGSTSADLYTRARVALTGLFALNPSEAIYFSANVDNAGRTLRTHCTYVIDGKPFVAQWWSITAYADDNFLIPNPANRFSFNMGNLPTGTDGRYRIVASSAEQTGNWLPTGTGGRGLILTLRLYNASPEILRKLSSIELPSIKLAGSCP